MNTIELVSKIDEFVSINEMSDDDDLEEALVVIVKLLANPDIAPDKAVPLINKLQALSAKFAILATWYTTVGKGPSGSTNYFKKNMYYTLRDSLDKLVDALKYTVRYGNNGRL